MWLRALSVLQLLLVILQFQGSVLGWSEEPPETPPSDVLLITMGGTRSHRVPFVALAKGLIAKGHRVTLLNAFKENRPAVEGLEEVVPEKLHRVIMAVQDYDYLGTRIRNEFLKNIRDAYNVAVDSCSALLTDPATKSLLKRPFQLVVIDSYFMECAVGLVPLLRAPFVFLNTMTNFLNNIALSGSPAPWPVTPAFNLPFTDHMTFGQRLQNSYMMLLIEGLQRVVGHRIHQLQKRHLDRNAPHPFQLARSVSFVLQNGHPVVSSPSPFLPNVAQVGGIHCRPAQPLPQDLQDYLDGAGEQGFVFVSMGTSVNPTTMPPELLRTIVAALGRLPYRVLWKFQRDLGALQLPPNVRIETWLPQQDVLGHRNIRAFVTHSGMFGTQETVYHGVPVVTLPVFADQESNSVKVVREGFGIRLELATLTVDQLVDAVTELVTNPQYKAAARLAQAAFLDQPEPPLERAVFWLEYVIRHRGATHLRGQEQRLNWIQYYGYDQVLLVVVLLGVLLKVVALSRRVSIRITRGQREVKGKTL